MTFLTKHSLIVKKKPLIEGKCDEEVIDVDGGVPSAYYKGESRLSILTFICLIVIACAVLTAVAVSTIMFYFRDRNTVYRYQGFCSIPMKDSGYDKPMPLFWSSDADGPKSKLLNNVNAVKDALERTLIEHVLIDKNFEKIFVNNNGHDVKFLHNFATNTTGVIDLDRCFVMGLEPDLVLSPELFMLNIEEGGAFDVSHVRSTLSATLPALHQPQKFVPKDMFELCSNRPVYKLMKQDVARIRKREVDAPPHDYIQFAGRHVQEIQISNLGDLLQHEQAQREK